MDKFIELNAFVKLKGLATTGGRAKLLIRSGAVMVNDVSETRNRRKLIAGDKVSSEGKEFVVEEGMVREH